VRPFLLLATRAEDVAADEEYEAFLRFGELDESQLERRRVEQAPLGEVDFDGYSGILLGGSPFTVSDEAKSDVQRRVEKELDDVARRAVAADFPFFGACYGIGIVGRAVGGTVDTRYGEDVSAPVITLTDAGVEDPLFGVLPRDFEAFVGHKEAVHSLPRRAVVLASSPLCPVQAFRIGRHVYATQFHPELDAQGIQTRIETYRHHGYFAPEEVDELKAMADSSHVEFPPLLVRRFIELHRNR
jgi:GMP synthase (glutamine-hydrolysing)